MYPYIFRLLFALITVESNFNPDAISEKGAKGLMQIMPIGVEEVRRVFGHKCGDLFDREENITCGLYLLKNYMTVSGNIKDSLRMYNGGYRAVELRGQIKESEEYVTKICSYSVCNVVFEYDVLTGELTLTELRRIP